MVGGAVDKKLRSSLDKHKKGLTEQTATTQIITSLENS